MSEPPPPGAAASDARLEGDEEEDEGEAFFLEEGEALRETVLEAGEGAPEEEDAAEEAAGGSEGAGGGSGARAAAAGAGAGGSGGAAAQPARDDSAWTASCATDAVYCVAFHPAEQLVVCGGGDETPRAFAPPAAEPARELSGAHSDSIVGVAFSGDGTLLATAGCDAKVLVWSTATGDRVASLEGPAEGIEWVQWHPRGHVVLAGAEDFTAWMWNADSGGCMQVFTGHAGSVTCGGFTPDGRAVVTAAADSTLRVWDPRTGACASCVQGHGFHEGAINCMGFAPDGNTAITGGDDGLVCVTNLAAGRAALQLKGHADSVVAVAYCASMPSMAASAGADGKLIVWDVPTGTVRAALECGAPATAMVWLPTAAPTVVVATTAAELIVFDARAAKETQRLIGHADSIIDMKARANSDGSVTLLTGSDDKTVKLWKM